MDANASQLPWDRLQHQEGGIPWPALRTFAEAVVHDTSVVQGLFDLYEQAHKTALTKTNYGDLYVPAIFALAAPKLDDEQRRTVGTFLIDKLVAAGRDDGDLGPEVLTAAAGAMGPAILPALLDAIGAEPDPHGAWLWLWDLTLLAAQSDDQLLRERVIRACVELLERAERDEIESWEATHAAWTLGMLKCTEYTELLERMTEKTGNWFEVGDYEDALRLLQGCLEFTPMPELWERPVEEWLQYRWKIARDWYAHRQEKIEEALDRDLNPLDMLATRFVASPIARSLPIELLPDARYIVQKLIDFSCADLYVEPDEWDESMLRELLLTLVPCKLVVERPVLEKVAPVTEAFLVWLGSEGLLDDAPRLAATVHQWSEEIVSVGANPDNWGPIKAFAMRTIESGQDLRDPVLRRQFIDEQFQGIIDSGIVEREPEPTPDEPPIPIVETKRKVGRNDPCPCGSGRKYKKCCGSPSKTT